MITALDYASPSIRRLPNRLVGWPTGVFSFCISIYVAKGAIDDAFWLTHYPTGLCGHNYAFLEHDFWMLPGYQAFATAGGVACAKFRAGLTLSRIGVVVGVLTWIGAYISMW